MEEKFAKNSRDSKYDEELLKGKTDTENKQFDLDTIKTNEISNSMNVEIKLSELIDTFDSTKNTSAGPDGIPNIFIKTRPATRPQYSLGIYNSIWLNDIFPNKWREATVIPIPKAGKSPDLTGNYRPIALTCCSAK